MLEEDRLQRVTDWTLKVRDRYVMVRPYPIPEPFARMVEAVTAAAERDLLIPLSSPRLRFRWPHELVSAETHKCKSTWGQRIMVLSAAG